MGKVKNRKKNRGAIRPNPVGIPSVQDLLQHEEEEGDGVLNGHANGHGASFIQTTLEQLKSHTVEERDSGLNSLASICGNQALLDEVLKQHDVVKIVGPMLTDKSAIIRHSAAGALRNISSCGSDICDFMVSQGVMTHIVLLLKQHYAGDWDPLKNVSRKQDSDSDYTNGIARIDSVAEGFIQVANLLWNLCESSESALKSFNQYNLAVIITKGLQVAKYGHQVAIASAQCLHAVTEDNVLSCKEAPELDTFVQKLLASDVPDINNNLNDWMYLQILVAGVALNLQKGDILKLSSHNIAAVLRILSTALGADHILLLKQLSSEVPVDSDIDGMETDQIRKQNTNEDIDLKKLHCLEQSIARIDNLLNAQMLALEILSNILFVDDEDVESTDDEDDSGESVIDCADDDVNQDCVMDTSPSGVISEVFEGVIAYLLVEKVLSKANFPPVNVLQILNENSLTKSISEKLVQIRCRALICYQNMVSGLDIKDLGGFEKMKLTWESLGQLIAEVPDTSKSEDILLDQLEAVTSAMRAIVQKWTENPLDVGLLTTETFAGFYNIFTNTGVEKVHANIIKIIGGLGILITRKSQKVDGTEELLFKIGEFLLNCICSNSDRQHLCMVAEALDTIFDVFSEDDYNHILNQLKMIERLKAFLPQFKKVIRIQRRELGENKAIVDTARLNLSRFIEYKLKHGCY